MSLFMLICRKICFAAIYAVLAQNLFCRDLRTFVWRKIYSEIVLVEKKGQISGMGTNMLVLFLILILDLELWGSTMVGIVANKNSLI